MSIGGKIPKNSDFLKFENKIPKKNLEKIFEIFNFLELDSKVTAKFVEKSLKNRNFWQF